MYATKIIKNFPMLSWPTLIKIPFDAKKNTVLLTSIPYMLKVRSTTFSARVSIKNTITWHIKLCIWVMCDRDCKNLVNESVCETTEAQRNFNLTLTKIWKVCCKPWSGPVATTNLGDFYAINSLSFQNSDAKQERKQQFIFLEQRSTDIPKNGLREVID